jgi:hypothetical protein
LNPSSAFALWFARVVKRLSLPNMVRCVALAPGESYKGSKGQLNDPITFEQASGNLVVSNASGRQRWSGALALANLGDALAMPRFFVTWLARARVRQFIEPRLRSLVSDESRFVEQMGLTRVVGKNEPSVDEPVGRARLARGREALVQGLCLFVMVCCTSQVLIENRAIPKTFKPQSRPDWMTAVVVYPRLFQGWSMFAPDPPHDDGKIVVEGLTKDGRRFDPLSQAEPNYGVDPPEGFEMNQIWGDFHRRIWQPRFRVYWNGVRDYLIRHHEITGRPNDELVGFEVYYVSQIVPLYGQPPNPVKKERLFSWGNMRASQNQPSAPRSRSVSPKRSPRPARPAQ